MHSWPDRNGTNLEGLSRAADLLARQRAVVVPNPPPMTYGLIATAAATINAVKGRPVDQRVAVSLHDMAQRRRLIRGLDLPIGASQAVTGLLRRRLTVLLPVRFGALVPDWMCPAVHGAELAAFNGWWAPTAILWQRFPRLYGSSANRTGEPPAGTAGDARQALGPDCLVINGDVVAGPGRRRAASTMVRLDRRGGLSLYRSGAQDQNWSGPGPYLPALAHALGLIARPLTP